MKIIGCNSRGRHNMYPGAGKYPIEAITDWDKEIKKHISDNDSPTENNIDDFGEFVLTLQYEDDIDISSSSISHHSTLPLTSNTKSHGTVDVSDFELDLFSFQDNIESYEDRTERRLDAIEKRLHILEPKSEMIEKYSVLQDLYYQYRAAEALLYGNDTDENEEEIRN